MQKKKKKRLLYCTMAQLDMIFICQEWWVRFKNSVLAQNSMKEWSCRFRLALSEDVTNCLVFEGQHLFFIEIKRANFLI